MHDVLDPVLPTRMFKSSDSDITTHKGPQFKTREKKSTNTHMFQNFFTNRIMNMWNKLPTEAVNAGTLNAFNSHSDRHFSKCVYTLHWFVHVIIIIIFAVNICHQRHRILSSLCRQSPQHHRPLSSTNVCDDTQYSCY